MERRDFLKTSILTVFSLYGFSKTMPCFAGSDISVADEALAGRYVFTGVYYSIIEDGRVAMPDVFSRQLLEESVVLVVPERNSSVMVFPEESPEWKGIRQMIHEANKENLTIFQEHAEIDSNGAFYLSDRIIEYAGISEPSIAVTGRGYAIEIIRSEHQV